MSRYCDVELAELRVTVIKMQHLCSDVSNILASQQCELKALDRVAKNFNQSTSSTEFSSQ